MRRPFFAVCMLLIWPVAAHALEIRVAPSDSVFLNENNRLRGIYDVMLQNIAVVNDADEDVTLQRMDITGVEYGQPILADIIHFEHYEQRWESLEKYLDRPGGMTEDDSFFWFAQLLPKGVVLSPTTTLAPRSAVIVHRRLLAFSDWHAADSIRIHVTGVAADGRPREAETTLKVVLYKAKNEYRFPVAGRWYINASSSVRSHHRSRPAHEFALDLLKIGDDCKSYRGAGTHWEDYYAFGEEVYAAADGVVIRAVNDVPETELPRENETRKEFAVRVLDAMWEKDPSGRIAEGNLVIIEHAGGEYSTYVHLESGSVRVKAGDHVRQGQVIGQIGMSGDGFQPHLHFQVNTGPDPQYSRALPVLFTNVRPVAFASTTDMDGDRLFMAGEFVETVP